MFRNGIISDEKRSSPQVIADFWLLMKPELTSLSVFSALASAYLAVPSEAALPVRLLVLAGIGTMLAGGGAAALNQYLERRRDASMMRTHKRPLASGRIDPRTGLAFGLACSMLGIGLLALMVDSLAAVLAAATILTYIGLYTPLKHISSVSTVVGAIPGALPVLIGWASVEHGLSLPAVSLFAIVFYWQMPHFYALAWLYRNDYSKGGFKLLSTIDTSGTKIGRHVVVNLIILLIIGCLPYVAGITSAAYLLWAGAAGCVFLIYGIFFMRSIGKEGSQKAARSLFYASLAYLPAVLILLIIFKI